MMRICPFTGDDPERCDIRTETITAHHLAWHATYVLLPTLDRLLAEGADGRKYVRLMVTLETPVTTDDGDVHFTVSGVLDDAPAVTGAGWKVTGVALAGGSR